MTGMVLMASAVKEYDKRVELLTRERGRITAFAQGARRPNNSLSACTIPFTFGTYELVEGRTSYQVYGCQIQTFFEEVAADFDSMCMASYFAEMARYFTRENVEASRELLLLYVTLRAVTRADVDLRLIRRIYEFRMMCVQGEGLEVFGCLGCGRQDGPFRMHLSRGGILCPQCEAKLPDSVRARGMALQPDTLYTLQVIQSKPLEKLYSFRVAPQILEELERLMDRYLEQYLHHEFKSLSLL